jgi:hypothetical protein
MAAAARTAVLDDIRRLIDERLAGQHCAMSLQIAQKQ